jgi:hypothetical protein
MMSKPEPAAKNQGPIIYTANGQNANTSPASTPASDSTQKSKVQQGQATKVFKVDGE